MADPTEDPFAGGVEISDGSDPFAGDEFAGFEDINKPVAAEPEAAVADAAADDLPSADAPAAETTADLPVVDKEGNAVDPALAAEREAKLAETAKLTPEEAAKQSMDNLREMREAEEQQARLREVAQREAAETVQQATAAAAAELAASLRPDSPQDEGYPTGDAPAAMEPTPPASDSGGESGSATEPAPPAPKPTAKVGEPAPEPEPEDAPPPEEKKDKNDKVTMRRYYIMRVAGPGKFEQVFWYELDGKMVSKGTPGCKRQTVCLSRGAEGALKVGFAALGAPQDGVKLVAVAALHFQPKTIRPAPVVPQRVRLEIS
jgi:hypothetical protein